MSAALLETITTRLANTLNYAGLYHLGLRTQDVYLGDDVQEAIRRLPAFERNAREQRLKVAFDLFTKKQELPLDQQMTEARDFPYLQPYLDLVHREAEERAAFRQ